MDNIKKEDEINEDIIKTEDHFDLDIKEEKCINLEDAFSYKETFIDKSWRIEEERNENLELNTMENLTKDGNIGNHICVNCCSAYANEGSLLAHMESCQFELKNDLFHKTEENVTSPIESFNNKQLLVTSEKVDFSRYQRSVQQKTKPFNCIECDYKCCSKSRLSAHIRAVHKKEKPFQCSECDYKFTEKYDLKKHIKAVHNKEKPFNCSECNHKCSLKSSLFIHIRSVHKKEKPFQCNDCASKYSEKGTLARHIRAVHKKEKPFQCSECDYKCSLKSNLSIHIRAVHKN